MIKPFLFFLILLSGPFVVFGQQSINTDESKVSFEVSNMRFNTVEGTFSGMTGTIQFDPTDLSTASMDVCVDASSVDTDNKKRDEHLRKDDFFDVEKYPTICFKSSSVTKTSSGYEVRGMLTMHGISKEVSIPFTFTEDTMSGNLSIERTDYKV
ncbi:MAG: YceI family protein, partial [Bacteroidota bacterium]